jgi:hypothetical protein
MDVRKRIKAGLPLAVEDIEAEGPWQVADLWLCARAYSRLRHKAKPPREQQRFATLKIHCIRVALARDPGLFLVFVDPGFSHLRLIYHRAERNLLHVPVNVDLWPAPRLASFGETPIASLEVSRAVTLCATPVGSSSQAPASGI